MAGSTYAVWSEIASARSAVRHALAHLTLAMLESVLSEGGDIPVIVGDNLNCVSEILEDADKLLKEAKNAIPPF